ncbi:MAG: GIY-YIG nuclease family protein [Candidatus Omnitrophota bacterium]|jgi:putative endonuclease
MCPTGGNNWSNAYYVYIVRCRNGTCYTGFTKDLEKRIKLHNNGRGAKFLRNKGPFALVFVKE